MDRELEGPAICLMNHLKKFGSDLEKIKDMKENYNSDYIEVVVDNSDDKKGKPGNKDNKPQKG